jgi:hypothetical protein
MKHLRIYEDCDISNVQNWWTGIKTHEDDDYIYIDLDDIYLINKTIQLNKGLQGKPVEFFCMNHEKMHEKEKITGVSYNENTGDLVFSSKNARHYIRTSTPIKICKFENDVEK